ncbi:hypothetical protein [Helcococcus ovis]|uniref:hypothetical protein n=1 Tax=Helcococcus ovis TaxID=72026 RepID=UPI0038BDE67A
MKKIFYSIFRIILIYLLLNMLFNILIHQENMKMNMSEFINYGFNSIYAFDMFGNHRLDFIKFLISLSLFILVEFDLIVFISDCSQGFKEIIKYHSKNKFNYILKLFLLFKRYILNILIYWIILFAFSVLLINKVAFYNFNDVINLIVFIFINVFLSYVFTIYSKNTLTAILLFVSKIFIFNIFFGNIIILGLVLVLLIFAYLFVGRIGESI